MCTNGHFQTCDEMQVTLLGLAGLDTIFRNSGSQGHANLGEERVNDHFAQAKFFNLYSFHRN